MSGDLNVPQFSGKMGVPRPIGGRKAGEKPEQLKMFMSSREIEAKWSPLDADREDQYEGTVSRSDGTLPSHYRDTSMEVDSGAPAPRKQYNTPGGRGRANSGSRLSMKHVWGEHTETNDELWNRKADEAYGNAEDGGSREIPAKRGNSFTMRSATTGGRENIPMGTQTANTYEQPQGAYFRHDESETLGDSIERTGVQSPVHLGRKIGSEGKPMIVGGHHRMAVMRNLNPDQLMPVMHHENIHGAKAMKRSSGAPWDYS